MSRIGKKTIAVPKGVTVTLDGQTVSVKGPKGERSWTVAEEIEVKHEGDELSLGLRTDTQRGRAMWGLSRTLVDNMVPGVTTGFEKSLDPPAGVSFAIPKQTEIKILGADKQAVGQIAAVIRKLRPPEPYKGKGVRYAGETVRRKEGKKK